MSCIRNRRTGKLLQLLLLLWIAFIWLHSAIPAAGSSEESRIVGNFIRPLLELFLGKGNLTDHIVRKLAHFTEYTVLGVLMGLNVAAAAEKLKSRLSSSHTGAFIFFCWSYGLLLAMAVAVIDESIQIFSPGRSPQVTDVLLDTAGSSVGLLLMRLLFVIRHKCRKNLLAHRI